MKPLAKTKQTGETVRDSKGDEVGVVDQKITKEPEQQRHWQGWWRWTTCPCELFLTAADSGKGMPKSTNQKGVR